jgi:hypothetical protein
VTDAQPEIDWQPAPITGERDRGLRDDPGRIVLLIAAVGLVLGGLMPWAEGRDPAGFPVAYTPQAGLAEGYLLLVSALILAILASGRVLVESGSRTVQLLPLAVAVVALAMWLGADRTSLMHIEEWTSGGGFGAQTVWRVLTAGAIVAIVAGTIWLEFTRPAEVRGRTRGLVAEWRPSRVGLTEAVVAGVFGIAGALIGGALTIVALGPNGSIFAVFVSLVGMAAGISAGVGIVRWVTGGGDRGSSDGGSPTSSAKQKVSVSRVVRRRS